MALYWLTFKERFSKKKWICQLFKFEAIPDWNCYNSTNLALDSYRIHYSKMLTSFRRYPEKLDLYSCKLTWSNLPLKITNLSFPEQNSTLPSEICFCLLFSFISVDIWQWFQLRNSLHSSNSKVDFWPNNDLIVLNKQNKKNDGMKTNWNER